MKLAILGAGAIGGYIGGMLAAGGAKVVMIGRERVQADVRHHGMTLTSLDGTKRTLAREACHYETDVAALADADIVFVTVKSRDTPSAAAGIARHAPADALVISFQNGVDNAEALRSQLATQTVLAGMVPWNVVMTVGGVFHRATDGILMIEDHPRSRKLRAMLELAGLRTQLRPDMRSVLWSKLLHNLNNAINALSGKSLIEELSDRNYRICLAATIAEALGVLKAANLRPAKIAKIAPQKLPMILRLPNVVYQPMMRRALKADGQARSSMQDDVRAGRPTEIDALNGAVVRLAKSLHMGAPLNAQVTELVKHANPLQPLRGEQLRRLLNL